MTERARRAARRAVTIIRPEGLDDDVPVVLFLHGWGATEPRTLPALARAPRPRGQRRDLPALPGLVRRAARAGPRQRRARRARRAASGSTRTRARSSSPATRPAARSRRTTRRSRASVGLPPPRAVFAAYPGRRFAGARVGIPPAGEIPPGVEVLALRGADDRVVDPGAAREIGARGRLLVVRTAGARDHLAPQRDDPVVAARVLGPARRADRPRPRLEVAANVPQSSRRRRRRSASSR